MNLFLKAVNVGYGLIVGHIKSLTGNNSSTKQAH